MESLGHHDSNAYDTWLESVRREGDEVPGLIEAVAPKAKPEVSVSPTDVDERCKVICTDVVETYIRRCEEIMLMPLRANEYLRLIPAFMPMKHVYVGQSSYNEAILPRYASAFAFDINKSGSWTPSVQVLSQAMAFIYRSSLSNCLCLLANSFVLITRSILMVNVFPYSSPNDHERAKLGPVFAEFLSEIIMLSRVMGIKKIQVREFGDVAQEYCDMAWKSIKSSIASMRHVDLRNLVYVSRRFGVSKFRDYGPDAPELCRMVDDIMAKVPEPSDVVAVQSKAPTPPRWQTFTLAQLQGVAASDSLAQLHEYSSAESILSLTTEFVEAATAMASKGKGHKQQQQKPNVAELGYTAATLLSLSNTAKDMIGRVDAAYKTNRDAISRLSPGNAEQAGHYVETLKRLCDVMTTSVGMFASVHGTMVSDTPAVALNSASVPPMVRQVPPEDIEHAGEGGGSGATATRGPDAGSTRGASASAESRRRRQELARARSRARASGASDVHVTSDALTAPGHTSSSRAQPQRTSSSLGPSEHAYSHAGSDDGMSQGGLSEIDVFTGPMPQIVDTRVQASTHQTQEQQSVDSQQSTLQDWRVVTPQPGDTAALDPSTPLSPSVPATPPMSDFSISDANSSVSLRSPATPSRQRAADRRRTMRGLTTDSPAR